VKRQRESGKENKNRKENRVREKSERGFERMLNVCCSYCPGMDGL
jgi:hypothetical protein